MKNFQGRIISQLPHYDTSIFSVMSKLANEHNAINLSQGFPDFDISEELIELVNHYMKEGYNQYAPMQGVLPLRQNISKKVKKTYDVNYDPEKEINITAGATQAIYTIISAFIKDDDEVIIFEPAYDSYAPAVELNGGRVKYAKLKSPTYEIDWNELPKMITIQTKLIIINSPHNPTGAIISKNNMIRLESLTKNTDIVILSDEVYEHLIFDEKEHQSVCRFPKLAERSFVVGSFGKTFHATGWKIGFVLAPENLMTQFRKAHQFIVYACNTPIQYAIADFLTHTKNYNKIGKFYQKKRDFFVKNIQKSRFKIIQSHGTYFQLLDYSNISDINEMDFALWLIKEHGIAAIPVSSFYHRVNENKMLRFCFAKKDETLKKAAQILCKI